MCDVLECKYRRNSLCRRSGNENDKIPEECPLHFNNQKSHSDKEVGLNYKNNIWKEVR